MVVAIGRFGPYIKLDDAFISIPRTLDPLSVDLEKAIEIIKEKELTDAPVAHFNSKPVTKGKGRFGPFIKYEGLFINVPRAYDFENLSQANINELIEKKLDKEANRYIQHWPEEKISIENARWGPIIKFGKLVLKLLRGGPGGKFSIEELSSLSLDEVKKMIVTQVPKAFDKKGGAKKANKGIKKAVVKKIATKKTTKKAKTTKKVAIKKVSSKKVIKKLKS